MKNSDNDPPTSSSAARDAETIELFGDFVAESEDGLCRVDEILLSAQRSSLSDEHVNELFRVFHTIKGVSGFLEALDVTRLAHVTETLLDGARSHRYQVKGRVLDAVFEASSAMRTLFVEVRSAVQADRAIARSTEVPAVVERVEYAAEVAAKAEHVEVSEAELNLAAVEHGAPSIAHKETAARPASDTALTLPPRTARPEVATAGASTPELGGSQSPIARQSTSPRGPKSAAPASRSGGAAVEHARAQGPQSASPATQGSQTSVKDRPASVRAPATPAASPKAPPAARSAGAQSEGNEPAIEQSVERGAVRLRETVKVDLERIDSVVEMIGELLIVESMVVSAPEIAALPSLRLRNYLAQLTKISRDLQGVAMRMRMIPLRGVFHKMARLTRDLSRKTGKAVELVQLGEATEMDRSMVERIEEPLVHMIRNAMDHAIESAEERKALGKPEVATIRLSAHHEAGCIAIEITDDGRGLRRDIILAKARERGLISEETSHLTDDEVCALIFLPGFSTARELSELSGRGVGMDVVKRSIEMMRGRTLVKSTPGVGTTFKLILPLTLAIIDGMLVSCAGETYIIPSLAIVESLQVSPGMLGTLGERGELLNVRGEILPLVRLRHIAGMDNDGVTAEQSHIVVLESAGRKLGLLVDEVVTQQQIVIKPLSGGLGDTELFAGAAILSDGRVGLILNVDRIGAVPSGLRSKSYDRHEVFSS